jgi:hypothetical protein
VPAYPVVGVYVGVYVRMNVSVPVGVYVLVNVGVLERV